MSSIIGTGVANSTEIIGCWDTKGSLEVLKWYLGEFRCALEGHSQKSMPESNKFFPMSNFFLLLLQLSSFSLEDQASGYKAQAGSVFSGNVKFQEQHIWEWEGEEQRGEKKLKSEFSCGASAALEEQNYLKKKGQAMQFNIYIYINNKTCSPVIMCGAKVPVLASNSVSDR